MDLEGKYVILDCTDTRINDETFPCLGKVDEGLLSLLIEPPTALTGHMHNLSIRNKLMEVGETSVLTPHWSLDQNRSLLGFPLAVEDGDHYTRYEEIDLGYWTQFFGIAGIELNVFDPEPYYTSKPVLPRD